MMASVFEDAQVVDVRLVAGQQDERLALLGSDGSDLAQLHERRGGRTVSELLRTAAGESVDLPW